MKNKWSYRRSFDANSSKIRTKKIPKLIEDIWREFERRRVAKVSFEDGSATKNESAKNFLRREIYALGIVLLDRGPKIWKTRDFIDSMRETRTTRPDALSNVFHVLLMSVYETDSAISRKERSLMAKELEYAHRHSIPPELLCGFLYQSSDRKRVGERLRDNFIEPAFRVSEPDA